MYRTWEHALLVSAAAMLLIGTTACASSAPDEAPTGTPSTSTIEPSGPNDVDAEVPPAPASPTRDAPSREAAATAATSAMEAFTSHLDDEDAWWAALEPMLSRQAAADYAGTDPAQVPARAVTGEAELVDDSSAYLAVVEVPTDAGTYQVMLSRAGAGELWLVERLTPPSRQGLG